MKKEMDTQKQRSISQTFSEKINKMILARLIKEEREEIQINTTETAKGYLPLTPNKNNNQGTTMNNSRHTQTTKPRRYG